MGQLTDKIALVTGGSRGIGRAIAVALAKEGAKVVVNYAGNQAAAEQTAALIADVGGPEAVLAKFDVGDTDAVKAALDGIKKDLGGLHILVNNAGISRDGLLMRYKDADWDATMNTNLKGAFNTARAAARTMMKQREGRIINISSVVGEMGNAGQVSYAAAKAGMIGMTKSLAKELASRNITANVVTPGFIQTDMTGELADATKEAMLAQVPLGRIGTPDDVAEAVVFLAGPGGAYITGSTIQVNGGMYM